MSCSHGPVGCVCTECGGTLDAEARCSRCKQVCHVKLNAACRACEEKMPTCSCGLVLSDEAELKKHLTEFPTHRPGGDLHMTDGELHRQVKTLEDKVKHLEDDLAAERKKHADDVAKLWKHVRGLDDRTLGSLRIG